LLLCIQKAASAAFSSLWSRLMKLEHEKQNFCQLNQPATLELAREVILIMVQVCNFL
jgi:hypothetical protein